MSLKTFSLALFTFLLPWQTRWIFGQSTIAGEATPFGVMSIYATEVLLLIAALLSVVRRSDRPHIDATYRLPLALAFSVFAVAALSLVRTPDLALSLVQLGHLGAAMVFFVFLLDRKLPLRPLMLAFGMGLVAPSLLGIAQIVFDVSPASTLLGLAARDAQALGDAVTVAADGARQLRAYGSFSHPNAFGGYLAVGVLALRAWVGKEESLARGRAMAEGGKRKEERRMAVCVMLLLTVTLVLTASRSAILGLLLGIGLAGLVARMRDTAKARIVVIPIAMAVIGGALAAMVCAPQVVASLRGGGATEDASVIERMIGYANYPRVINNEWLFGLGIGTYALHAAVAEPGLAVWAYQPMHNVPLLIIAEIGIVGALAVLAWSSVIDRMNFARFPNRDALVAFAMGNVILVVLFFDHYVWSSWSGLALIAFVMAMTVRMGEGGKLSEQS